MAYALPSVMVADVHATTAAATMLTVFKMMSAADVPTEQSSTMVVPSDLKIRAHVAVPVELAEASDAIAFNVSTPAEAAGANVALQTSSANTVVIAPPVAGRVPE